jgi:ubiquinone/menaquinone biosynthesis C-methylase UbiE
MSTNSIEKNIFFIEGILKSLVHLWEYNSLVSITKMFDKSLKAPTEHKEKKLLKILLKELIHIHKIDSENRKNKIYYVPRTNFKFILEHLRKLPLVFYDSLEVSKKRFNNDHQLDLDLENVPNYHHRNFHFQTNGYFSKRSAMVYDHQVEMLFNGTAQVMRRLLISKIKKAKDLNRPLKVLEIGGGTGNMIEVIMKSFDVAEYVLVEPSIHYLNQAKKNNIDVSKKVKFVQAYGENLSFEDNEFDLVFSIYLFHELPQNVRESVITEMRRVCSDQGIVAIADSIQLNDHAEINVVLKSFAKDYHEPFYNDYISWNLDAAANQHHLKLLDVSYQLLTKYWIYQK